LADGFAPGDRYEKAERPRKAKTGNPAAPPRVQPLPSTRIAVLNPYIKHAGLSIVSQALDKGG